MAIKSPLKRKISLNFKVGKKVSYSKPNDNIKNESYKNNLEDKICFLNNEIISEYKTPIFTINSLLNSPGTHALISSVDPYILNVVNNIIVEKAKEYNLTVSNKYPVDFKNKIIIFNCYENFCYYGGDNDNNINTKTMYIDSMLYNLFEKSKKNNFYFFILSTDSSIVENMEKRVRSRFNHNIIFFPYISYNVLQKVFLISEENYLNIPAIDYHMKNYMNNEKKSNVKNIRIIDILEMLKSVHLIILFISKNNNTKHNTILNLYKKFTLNIPEIRKVEENVIIDFYYDLLELEFIDYKGRLNLDYQILYAFVVTSNCPQWMKDIIKNLK
ncbi:hypothetical protein SLOPH_2182 [Spraguea lophii 42_110]|uniref:Uncharacterized protein n=1 Tax=Spraguea lophii (strain 42_110) TaxID=1358809 RepID=S7W7R8_SPRLO|nr:hypothetical protein SLOPH_2182 [Spraguea lophii 42_110]